MKKLLLHICCGPCGTATIKRLTGEGYDVTGLYFNPNIHPSSEYKKRLMEARKIAQDSKIKLIEAPYNPREYFESIKGFEKNQKVRCVRCFYLRLGAVAKYGKENGFSVFTSTLSISPYQDQKELLRVAEVMSKKYKIDFYEKSFTSCYAESVVLSKGLGMYRQKYCGCIFSKHYC